MLTKKEKLIDGLFCSLVPSDIPIIQEHLGDVIVEPGCGSHAYLLKMLKGERHGVDFNLSRSIPTDRNLHLHRMSFESFIQIEDGIAIWNKANSVLMSYPDTSGRIGEFVIKNMLPHQNLVLIAPRPYRNITVAGTVEMWMSIFQEMSLVFKTPVGNVKVTDEHDPLFGVVSADMMYVLKLNESPRPDPNTKHSILNGHTLWELWDK